MVAEPKNLGYDPYGLDPKRQKSYGGVHPTREQYGQFWQHQFERSLFDDKMDEEKRRSDRDFGESARQFDKIFGEGVRREDRGFEEQQRQSKLGEEIFGASQARGEEASGQYDQLFNTPLAELGQYEQAIIDQSTPGQEQARQATIAALARQGVRGPQAALETSRQAGMMGQGMQNQLAGIKFKEAMDRRASKGKLKGEMSLQGLGGGL